jgi:hypothetical protein
VKWLVLLGVGFLIGLCGLVMLIIGIVRRQNARRPPAMPYGGQIGLPAGAAPPGWYPDPSIAGTVRWWDGYRWTEHTHQAGD